MIYIYYSYINEEEHNALLKTYSRDFPYQIQNKIQRYRRWQDAQLTVLGRLLLKYGMNSHFESIDFSWDKISYTEYGKPFMKNNPVHFNISHSGNVVICAFSESGAIGIDLEVMNPIEILDFKSQMTEGEWSTVNNAENRLAEFYKYWTQKEAVIKADGKGLSNSLKSFEIINNASSINNDLYSLMELDIDKHYTCYLALKTDQLKDKFASLSEKRLLIKQIYFATDRTVQIV